jgi:regulator of protease activity HflC (stomatin/prohibitin superfamily)
MIKFTSDTTGDVCNHARSRFIELVSKVTLQEFMTKFNAIAEKVHEEDTSNFYTQRGVKIHSLEVTGYRCAQQSTAAILEQIIQETTNRMNKLQQQESENEVQLKEIQGDIQEETAMAELIKIQTQNSNAKARMEGLAEAERVKSFLDASLPGMELSSKIQLWQTLRKEDALRVISKGNASLYFTPNDVNLSIQNHEHAHVKRKQNWADDSVSEE